MTTSEILRAAKARIDTPDKWWDGSDCTRGPGETCAWLAFDAAPELYALTQCELRPAENALARVMGVADREAIPAFNDSHTFEEVHAAFDQAIAWAEAAEREHTLDLEPVAA